MRHAVGRVCDPGGPGKPRESTDPIRLPSLPVTSVLTKIDYAIISSRFASVILKTSGGGDQRQS
jgi:hypothetical protein